MRFSVKPLDKCHCSNLLHSCSTHAIFFSPWENGQIDRLVTTALACRRMSVLNQTALSSARRANTLGRCAVVRSEVIKPQVTAPSCFSCLYFFYMFVCLFVFWVLFLGLVSVWVVFGWWCTCLLHSSHAAWYGNNVSRHDLQLSVSVIFKLLTGWLPSMLVTCCSGDIKPFFFFITLVTRACVQAWKGSFVVLEHILFLYSWVAGKTAV